MHIDFESGREFSLINEDAAYAREFLAFKRANPQYLERVLSRLELLYDTFFLLYNRRFKPLMEEKESYSLVKTLGMGMLLRHTLETLTMSLCIENGIDVGEETMSELLGLLEHAKLSDEDRQKLDVLHHTRLLTNGIAHPFVADERSADFGVLSEHYKRALRPLLLSHIIYLSDSLVYERTDRDLRKLRHSMLGYLLNLKEHLDDFNVAHRFTASLALGCLVRQLTECTVNLWCYNYYLLPTDASTEARSVELSEALMYLAEAEKHGGFAKKMFEPINSFYISDLYEMKNLSNCFMHVEDFTGKHIVKLGKELSSVYEAVRIRCYADNIRILFKMPVTEKRAARFSKESAITTLLCGIFGWFGVHHFYAGNIAKGILFLLTGGFWFGPIVSLIGICRGNFKTKKWGTLPSTPLNSLIALAFVALHVYLFYLLFSTPIEDLGVFANILFWRNFYN